MQQALSIPEILAQIGEFLDSKSLSICTRVSKSWSAAFDTILYRHISILVFNRYSPSIRALKRHARQTFSLTLTLPVDLGYFTLKCPSLRALHLHGWLGTRLKTIAGYSTRGHRKTLALIQQHQRTLITVSVGLLWPIAKSPEFWTAIAACPRLETLLVRDEKMFVNNGDHSEQEAFWNACTKVSDLKLKDLRFQAAVNVPVGLDFSQPPVVGASGLTTFTASWPKLRELTLSGQEIRDHDLAAVISTAEVLEKLSVPQTQFGRMAFAALRTHHFQVLRHLNLQDCESATSAMVQEVMESFPGLEYLRAPLLRSADVLLGAPWVCLQLKQLQLETFFLSADGIDEEVQKVALSARFGALKEVSLIFSHNLSIAR
ncbi:hypothetical protein BGZ74_010702 [Mortierella antarctica]|nr:hypothetical protein BGZ74_010702 [Mortierella antarctica]